ncbi:MAG: hydantoinase/oxoprolinase family protein [Planctomycetaceae bacterium]
MSTCIGLDIGGANIKLSNGVDRTIEIAFPLWKSPETLAATLTSLGELLATPPDTIALTMTGELADCFRTKADGVEHILNSVEAAFPSSMIRVWQTGAEFFNSEEAREFPILVAAANWHALATWAGRACPQGMSLLIDIGSTTTDVIPLSNGTPIPEGGTDPARLLSGELVYTGVRRTPLCAVAQQVEFRGQLVGMAAELFATTRDVHVWLGTLPEDPEDVDTVNNRPATREFARDRLVRMLCADADEVDEQETDELAMQWAAAQRSQIRQAISRVVARQAGPIKMVMLSGEGEFLARQVVEEVPELAGVEVLSLATVLGPEHSIGACAYAVARLASERP